MNTFSKYMLASSCTLLFWAQAAQADFGEITFNGHVDAPTCVVNGGSGSLPVSLPNVNASLLSRAGQTAGQTPFQLNLSACSPGITRVSTYFNEGPISPEGRLIVDDGGSRNVQLELLNDQQSPMNLAAAQGQQNSQVVQIVNGNATLRYTVRYYSTGGTTPGDVISRVQYALDYP
ncbi:fimbrial protein [Pseudomonas sp. NPDC089752]|uniref:fimbrial protein n=1 Tax=Pseudomonas sp. NPDC089752 TaxID=3364472 RepID=UPI00381C026C